MKRLLSIILILFLSALNANARSLNKNIQEIIRDSGIPKESISISVKNLNNGKNVFSMNEYRLMPPASVQKILTIIPIIETLGDDYEFKTELYSRGKDVYLIKLGADPYLTSDDLKTLTEKINAEKVQKIYIDNSIIEQKAWGEGWQWDDDLNTALPRFNAYNLDRNLTKITIMPTDKNKQAFIINPQKSPMIFYNNVITGDKNDVNISRDNLVSPEVLKLEGTVQKPETHYITNTNLKRYFEKKLTDTLEDRRIYLKSAYSVSQKAQSDKFANKVTHPINKAVEDVLLNSNNMVIEIMAKLAGGKYYNKQGTDIDGINLFKEYCMKNGIDTSQIRIADASGVSKNNLVNADFISEYLVKNKNNKIYEKIASPSQGTLSNRMIPLKDNLKAKTGTLSDISTIAGFLSSKCGQKYAFAIMINDPKSSNLQKKNLENYLIREMYLNL